MKLNQSHEIQKDVGKVAGEWYCPRCFIQNNVREDRCTACAEEKNDFYIVQTLSTSQKSKLKAKQNNQKALAKIANRNPEANIISHVCEWDWIYCDGIICQDPNYNRSIDIMEDLVENEYDEKATNCNNPIIVALPFDEDLLNQSLILVGLFPQTFRREDDDLSRSQPSTPRVKRQKKKEIGLKQINNLLQRREDNKEKERLNGGKEPEIIKKKPKTTNLRPKLRLYGPTDIPEVSQEDADDEMFSFGSTSDEDQNPEQVPVLIHTPEVDHDLNVALSLQFDSEHVAHKLSKSTEIKNTTAWPTLQPQGTIAPPSSPAAWPSLSPAASPQPKPASPWGSKPTAWGSQNLAQKLQALKTEK